MNAREIYRYIDDLEKDIARRDNSVENLLAELEKARQGIELRDRLVDLVAPSIIWQEEQLERMTTKRRNEMTEIVAAYRAIRPSKEAVSCRSDG